MICVGLMHSEDDCCCAVTNLILRFNYVGRPFTLRLIARILHSRTTEYYCTELTYQIGNSKKGSFIISAVIER